MEPIITQNDIQSISIEPGSGTQALSSTPLPDYPSDVSDPIADPIPIDYLGNRHVWHNTMLWDTFIGGGKVRPYIDIGLYPHGVTTRVPVVGDGYNVYADNATFYDDVEIKGELKGDLSITGVFASKKNIESVTEDKVINYEDLGKILQVEPSSGSLKITLPVFTVEQKGFYFEAVNLLEGKFTEFSTDIGELKAKGTGLSQVYSAATIYWTGEHWYAIGDLTPVA